jgi:lipopolysaccharide cholinephosphotransferase
MMPREDYEKMLKTFRHERYHLSESRNNPEAAIPFAQIYDTQTFLKWKKVKDPDLGVFIDIFPIDGYPENEFAAKIHTRRLWLLRFMNNIARKKLLRGEKYMVLKRILMLLFRKSPNTYAVRINRLGMKYPFRSSRFVGVTGTTDHLFKERNLKEAVFAEPDPLLLPFEDLMLPCPPGYDVYLTHLFGNYMQLPPPEKRITHRPVKISFDMAADGLEKELNDELNLREQELIAVQREEMEYLYSNYDKHVKQKQTPDYLNLKKIQYELAKQERFIEAANVKKKAEKLNKDQNEKMKIDAHMQLRKQIDKLSKKHQEEKMRLDDEKEKRWYLFQKEKNKEYDTIVNKYRSLKMQINLQQKEGQNQALKRLSKLI